MGQQIADCEVEELGHTSEIGLRARAATQAALFGCLASAMIALTGAATAHLAEGEPREEEAIYLEVELSAVDLESLLVDWLNEVLYLHEVSGIVPEVVDVEEITPRSMRAIIRGRRTRQMPALQIKAVTYHQLQIGPDKAREREQWQAEVFFDI